MSLFDFPESVFRFIKSKALDCGAIFKSVSTLRC